MIASVASTISESTAIGRIHQARLVRRPDGRGLRSRRGTPLPRSAMAHAQVDQRRCDDEHDEPRRETTPPPR
jgi:hypothetical protein